MNYPPTYVQPDGSLLDEDGVVLVETPGCKPDHTRGRDLVADVRDDDLIARLAAGDTYAEAFERVAGYPLPAGAPDAWRPWRPPIHATPGRLLHPMRPADHGPGRGRSPLPGPEGGSMTGVLTRNGQPIPTRQCICGSRYPADRDACHSEAAGTYSDPRPGVWWWEAERREREDRCGHRHDTEGAAVACAARLNRAKTGHDNQALPKVSRSALFTATRRGGA